MQDVHIVVNKHTPYVIQAFEQIGRVTALDTRDITRKAVKDADVLIVRSETKVDRDLLEGSRVKFVGTVTIGKDHVDEDYLAKNGIKFISAPGSNANSVGEYIVSALLELAHINGFQLDDKTIGIVGVGNVGSNVWRKAEALGMKVLLNDPPLKRSGSNYPLRPLDELMDADIITLHVPLIRSGSDATYHFFEEQRISKMKRGAVLINTSRGSVVNKEALKRALLQKQLSAAVLDVWEGEPKIDATVLELVSLGTPHIAGYSLDGKVNALRMNYEAVCRFLSVPVDRNINDLLPEPASPEIIIDNNHKSGKEVLRGLIKQCYDICEDDKLLRKMLFLSEKDRGEYFSKLRADYRVRREFYNRTVVLPDSLNNLSGMLKSLGFKLKIKKAQ